MTAASTTSIAAVGLAVWAGASVLLGLIAGKIIAFGDADDCGLLEDDSEDEA